MESSQDILEDTQWTDNGTVDSSEEERQHDKCHNDDDIECHHGRQELDFSKPSQPTMHRPREIEEKQGNQYENHCCEDRSDFP